VNPAWFNWSSEAWKTGALLRCKRMQPKKERTIQNIFSVWYGVDDVVNLLSRFPTVLFFWGMMKKFSGNCSIFVGTLPGHIVVLVLGRHVVTIVHVCYRLLFSICRYQCDSFCSLSVEISLTYIFTTMNKDTMNKCCIYIYTIYLYNIFCYSYLYLSVCISFSWNKHLK
jgi:hypothetical protein